MPCETRVFRDYTATDINKLGAVCLRYKLEKNKNGQLTGCLHEVAVKVNGFHPLSSDIVITTA